jgi:hypothetical protein
MQAHTNRQAHTVMQALTCKHTHASTHMQAAITNRQHTQTSKHTGIEARTCNHTGMQAHTTMHTQQAHTTCQHTQLCQQHTQACMHTVIQSYTVFLCFPNRFFPNLVWPDKRSFGSNAPGVLASRRQNPRQQGYTWTDYACTFPAVQSLVLHIGLGPARRCRPQLPSARVQRTAHSRGLQLCL